jgi:hypothetical protein
MPNITEEFVNALAPNQNAIMNGWGLVKKNKLVKLYRSHDDTILFGECMGSGSSNYVTSVDLIKPESPLFRCSCPSRQFPCKHGLGLMYAYLSGKPFEVAAIPAEILEKREKLEKRAEKKQKQAAKGPKKVNKSALQKKLKAQLEGLDLLDKILGNLAQSGLGTMNAKTVKLLDEQVKQLGNYYLPGPQAILRDFSGLFEANERPERIYTLAIDKLVLLRALSRKSREYLQKRAADPELAMDLTGSLDEQLGHVWQLADLKQAGMCQSKAELIQLCFNSRANEFRKEYQDVGAWLNLTNGQIQETVNYRPFKAVKYLREEDSFFEVMQVAELMVYPGGELNPRIRWENAIVRPLGPSDYARIRQFAGQSVAEAVKAVKNQIKNPLAEKFPLLLVAAARIGQVGERWVLEDSAGQRLVLEDHFYPLDPPSVAMLELLGTGELTDCVVLVRFHHNLDTGKLWAQPLTLIAGERMVRLTY